MPARNTTSRLLILPAVLLGALGLAACGGSDEPSAGPDQVTEQYVNGLATGDGAEACEAFSAAAIEDFEATEGVSCAEGVTNITGEVSEADQQAVADSTFEITEETDDTASVTATKPDGTEQSFELVLEDGAWGISQAG